MGAHVAIPAAANAAAVNGTDEGDWIEAAQEIAVYQHGYLEAAWADPDQAQYIPVEVTYTVTSGPSRVVQAPRSGGVTLAACGTRRTSWVAVNSEFKNGFGNVLFNLRMRKNFSYNGCRAWHESTITTPGTSTLGSLGGWFYDQITAQADGYEYANGNSYGRTYSERTGRWKTVIGEARSLWTRCHANWNGTHGCAAGSA